MVTRLAKAIVAGIAFFLGGCAIETARPHFAAPQEPFAFGEGVGRGDALCVPVKFEGKELLFVVDVGAPLTVMDAALADRLSGRVERKMGGTRLHGQGEVATLMYKSPALEIGGVPAPLTGEIEVADLELFREASGRPIQGVLGMDVLRHYVVRLDFRRRVLELQDAGAFEPPLPSAVIAGFPIKMVAGHPGAELPFVGLPGVPVILDTGMISEGMIHADTLKKMNDGPAQTRPSLAADATGESAFNEVRIDRRWTFAGTAFDALWLDEGNLDIVGLNLMSNYVVTFDFPRGWVYFESIRAEYRSLDKLGFGIARKENHYVIHHVFEAARGLGMQAGDEVVALDGKPVAVEEQPGGIELWRLREQLRMGLIQKMSVRRGEQTLEITLHREE